MQAATATIVDMPTIKGDTSIEAKEDFLDLPTYDKKATQMNPLYNLDELEPHISAETMHLHYREIHAKHVDDLNHWIDAANKASND